MLILVSYDIPDDRRRGRVAHALKDYGERVQLSVFECNLENESLERLRSRLPPLLEDKEDSVRIYRFRSDSGRKTEIRAREGQRRPRSVWLLVHFSGEAAR